jgi:hypothetical protein
VHCKLTNFLQLKLDTRTHIQQATFGLHDLGSNDGLQDHISVEIEM